MKSFPANASMKHDHKQQTKQSTESEEKHQKVDEKFTGEDDGNKTSTVEKESISVVALIPC